MATEIEVTDEETSVEVIDGTSVVEISNSSAELEIVTVESVVEVTVVTADIEATTVESVIEVTTIGPTVSPIQLGKLNRLIANQQVVQPFEVLLNFEPFIEASGEVFLNGTDPETAGVFFLL